MHLAHLLPSAAHSTPASPLLTEPKTISFAIVLNVRLCGLRTCNSQCGCDAVNSEKPVTKLSDSSLEASRRI